ncbi:polysaccharide deacetylase family protein [Yinghuangia seranimata]|uniref:polysaccharide deacetylase family protein n=1 Tax=Yinghuangia seranimata TaxID=408067 RepID=UPI00248C8ED3|nr:polysaccharide deacetylase family protein [Yinghuangia seranimata]MDI2129586.1 polysaccharide deacetylase family protein [Yinghuangia seranimata]
MSSLTSLFALLIGMLMVLTATAPGAAAAPRAAPRAVDCSRVKCIALTYDDGPASSSTARLLDTLKANGVKATFFMVGSQVARNPKTARRVAAEGHEIGNHTYSHKDLRRLTASKIRSEVARGATAIRNATGVEPTLVRPPYGSFNATVRANVNAPMILWSVDTRDWADRNASVVASRVIARARPGAIVLMHDIHPTTAAAAPRIIAALARQGYVFVTVSELLAGRALANGKAYSQR